jgi:hypothetical protein
MTKTKSEQSLLVSEGLREYWSDPRVRARRSIQAKVRERRQQLERLERRGMQESDRYKYIAGRLEELNKQLAQL